MDNSLRESITQRLMQDFHLVERGGWLVRGICPKCNAKELHTHADHPWVLRCNRINKCGYEIHAKELYADLFESWSDRYPKQDHHPNATADAYLREARGFDLSEIKDWYSQEYYWDHEKQIGSATVRFSLPGCQGGFWERIIDRPHRFGKRKATFRGNYGGTWWQPPNLLLRDCKELWIVEGIFDAIALWLNGIYAVSTLSCNNYPELALQGLAIQLGTSKRPTLVFAYDSDKAGQKFTRKWAERAEQEGWTVSAAQPTFGRDWNDLHQLNRLKKEHIETYRYYGRLLVARTYTEKAIVIFQKTGKSEFDFDFNNCLYWFKLDLDKFNKEMEKLGEDDELAILNDESLVQQAISAAGTIRQIANCRPIPLYYQANEITDESWYYFRIEFPHNSGAIKNTFTGSQLASAGEFKRRLLSIAPGAVWTGTPMQLDRLLSPWLENIKRVKTIDFIGYSKEHGSYVWGDFAVQHGKVIALNDEDFFDLDKLSLKTLSQSVHLHLNPKLEEFTTKWLGDLWTCFGAKGIVALAYWFGSLFAEQVRTTQKSYPFLEMVGEAGSGKSTLIEFLWKLCGRSDYEGFDPAKATSAARSRNFTQVSNLPVVLIESDRDSAADGSAGRARQSFDWDELKTAYNGRSVRSRGMKNNGNETYEPPFRGAIVISQNAQVAASEAILQRICHMTFTRKGHTEHSRQAAMRLEQYPIDKLSGFLLKASQSETESLQIINLQAEHYEQMLLQRPEIRHIRIAKNHGQVMATLDALGLVVELPSTWYQEAQAELEKMAIERQKVINADHPLVAEFWEAFEFLNGDDSDEDYMPLLNHSGDSQLIAVNLNHFVQIAAERKQQIPLLTDLKRVLKTSQKHKFLDIRTVKSVIHASWNKGAARDNWKPATIKCWVFQK